jgi:hypothetical protein
MIGPAIFVLIVIVLTVAQYGLMRDLGWHPIESSGVPWPSGLALGPYGWLQVLNFILFGLLLLTLSLLLTVFFMGWGLRRDPLWRSHGWYSLATGILFVVGSLIPGQMGTYVFLTVILGWMFLMALRLRSVAEGASARQAPRVR